MIEFVQIKGTRLRRKYIRYILLILANTLLLADQQILEICAKQAKKIIITRTEVYQSKSRPLTFVQIATDNFHKLTNQF